MNDNFNLRQFLTENRLTKASQVLAEAETSSNVNKWKGTPSRGAKTENTTCKYSLQEVRKNYRKFLREGIGKRKAIALLSKVYPGLNLMEALMDDSRTRSLRESSGQNSEYFRARVHSGRSDQSDLEEAVANVSGEYLNDDEPEDWNKDIVWNVLGHEVRDVASDKDYQGQDTVMIDGKWACEYPQKLVDAIAEKFNNNEVGEGRVVNTINPLVKGMRDDEDLYESRNRRTRSLREAGYTDDDEDFEDLDLDLDIDIDDPKARAAAEKAMRAAGEYEDFGDDPEDRPEPEEEDDDEEAPAKEEPKDELHAKGHWDIKYDPETVTLNFEDDEDLQDYLNGFRRPKIAAKYLQRKLDAAQYEIDEEDPEIGAKKTYLQLKDGLYFNYPFKRSDARLIATVRRHKDANI